MTGRRVRAWSLLAAAVCSAVLLGVCYDRYWRAPGVFPADPDELILFSVDGRWWPGEPPRPPWQGERLHDYPLLGKVVITDPARRREVLRAVDADIRTGHPRQAKCFWPRHVVRAVKDGHTVDVVICFECHTYEAYTDGRDRAGGTIGSGSKPLLNRLLTEAGVPLAPEEP